jgi:hypothetical protein
VNGDDLGDGLGSDAERVVGLAEGIEYGQLGIDLAQALLTSAVLTFPRVRPT